MILFDILHAMGKENQTLGQKYLELNGRIKKGDKIAKNLRDYGQVLVIFGAVFSGPTAVADAIDEPFGTKDYSTGALTMASGVAMYSVGRLFDRSKKKLKHEEFNLIINSGGDVGLVFASAFGDTQYVAEALDRKEIASGEITEGQFTDISGINTPPQM